MDYGCNCSRLLKHIIAQTHTQCLASVCDTELKDHLSELTQCACVCVNETDYSLSHERKLAYPYEEQMRKTRTHTSKHHRIKSAKWTSSVPSLKEAQFRTFYSIPLWFCCPFTTYTTRDDSHTHAHTHSYFMTLNYSNSFKYFKVIFSGLAYFDMFCD